MWGEGLEEPCMARGPRNEKCLTFAIGVFITPVTTVILTVTRPREWNTILETIQLNFTCNLEPVQS